MSRSSTGQKTIVDEKRVGDVTSVDRLLRLVVLIADYEKSSIIGVDISLSRQCLVKAVTPILDQKTYTVQLPFIVLVYKNKVMLLNVYVVYDVNPLKII